VDHGIVNALYLVAAVLFIKSLGGLSTQETAGRGNLLGVIGMTLAVVVTAAGSAAGAPTINGLGVLVAVLIGGGAIGAVVAQRVAMTSMPELVAILHSFVGLGAVLVGFAGTMGHGHAVPAPSEAARVVHLVEVFLGVLVGAVTFTGSIVAFAKLRGTVSGKPLLLPGRHLINIVLMGACLALGMPFLADGGEQGLWALAAMSAIAGVLGAHLVLAIGGADMPVVVSMLNSYSGWAAAAAGFMLENDLLIVTGALVGSSGAILSIIMCRAMNRSIVSVIFGGFGTGDGGAAKPAGDKQDQGEVQQVDVDGVAAMLLEAKSVVVVPGYGMAVAHAQFPLYEVAQLLRARGTTFRFAIHPVAGRLPGHMNVLLAEAKVPYDVVLEMDEINEDFPATDVVLVIGANDIVNPGAQDDVSSPIYGMPVLEVWKAKTVVVTKRGMATGYAGVENPLFFRENVKMLFGDAKKSVDGVLTALRKSVG
jgi:NAD(P) transhydrogenase subunit beta